jgi:CRP-like cAMP-binding protein
MRLESLRDQTPFLAGLSDQAIGLLEPVTADAGFAAGELIFEEDGPADTFYVITSGKVALEIELPSRGTSVVETLGPGSLLGVSWPFPPARWNLRARAVDTTDTIAFDASAVRSLCEANQELGAHVYRRVAAEAVRRLHATRIRLLDLYGSER